LLSPPEFSSTAISPIMTTKTGTSKPANADHKYERSAPPASGSDRGWARVLNRLNLVGSRKKKDGPD